MGPIVWLTEWLLPQRRELVRTWPGFTSSYLNYHLPRSSFLSHFSIYLNSRNTSSISHVPTVPRNIWIPQLITLIYLILYTSIFTLLLFKHLIIFMNDKCTSFFWVLLCYSTCPPPPPYLLDQRSWSQWLHFQLKIKDSLWSSCIHDQFSFIESTVNYLVAYAFFIIKKPNIADMSIVPKKYMSSVPNRVGTGNTLS